MADGVWRRVKKFDTKKFGGQQFWVQKNFDPKKMGKKKFRPKKKLSSKGFVKIGSVTSVILLPWTKVYRTYFARNLASKVGSKLLP